MSVKPDSSLASPLLQPGEMNEDMHSLLTWGLTDRTAIGLPSRVA